MQFDPKLPILLFIIVGFYSCSSTKSDEVISLQTYDIHDLDRLTKLNDKPIAVFIHADWCSYCRNMEQTTFKNSQIRKRLNTDYYFISFDGESKKDIRFQNKTYRFNPHGASSGTNELATELASINDQVSYPTFVIINSDQETPIRYNTFLSASDMAEILAVGANE